MWPLSILQFLLSIMLSLLLLLLFLLMFLRQSWNEPRLVCLTNEDQFSVRFFFFHKHFLMHRNNGIRDQDVPGVGRYGCELLKKAYSFRYEATAGHDLVPATEWIKNEIGSLSWIASVDFWYSVRAYAMIKNKCHRTIQDPYGQRWKKRLYDDVISDGPTDRRTHPLIEMRGRI